MLISNKWKFFVMMWAFIICAPSKAYHRQVSSVEFIHNELKRTKNVFPGAGSNYLFGHFFSSDSEFLGFNDLLEDEFKIYPSEKVLCDPDSCHLAIEKQLRDILSYNDFSGYDGYNDKITTYARNAIKEKGRLNLRYGESIPENKRKQLELIVLWPEFVVVEREKIVFPRIYVPLDMAVKFQDNRPTSVIRSLNGNNIDLNDADNIYAPEGLSVNANNYNANGASIDTGDSDLNIKASDSYSSKDSNYRSRNTNISSGGTLSSEGDQVNSGGNTSVSSTGDMEFSSKVNSQGDVKLESEGDIDFFTQFYEPETNHKADGDTFTTIQKDKTARTEIASGGSVTVTSGKKITGSNESGKKTGASISITSGSTSKPGNVVLSGVDGVDLGGHTERTAIHTETDNEDHSLLGSSETKEVKDEVIDTYVGSEIKANGGSVAVISSGGDTNLIGAKVVANNVSLEGNNVHVLRALLHTARPFHYPASLGL